MVESNDWVTPLFDYGIPFLGKPPLFIWLSALSVKVLGLNEFAIRFPSILCGLGVMWLCWSLARFQMKAVEANISVLILVSTAMFLVLAGAVLADPVLLFSTTMIISGFWIGWHSPHKPQAKRWQYAFFLGCGLGLLAKGPVALALAGLPIFFWCLPKRRLLTFFTIFPWVSGCLLTLLIAAPWYIAAERANPGFLEYFLIGEHFSRYLESGWDGDRYGHAHIQAMGTIWIRYFQAGLPWSLVMTWLGIKAIRHSLQTKRFSVDNDWTLFLWLWFLIPLVFFTFSQNIIWTYALTVTPAAALLIAHHWQGDWHAKRMEWLLSTATIVPVLILAVAIAFASGKGKPSQKSLIAAVHASSLQNSGEIIYWMERPFSARFYSKGQALLVNTPEELTKTLSNPHQNALIAKTIALKSLPDTIKQQFTFVTRYRDWEYWLQKPKQGE